MLVAFVVGWAVQRGWRTREDVSALFDVVAENSDFLDEIGKTSLKARNCFAAASELFNKCFERESRSNVI